MAALVLKILKFLYMWQVALKRKKIKELNLNLNLNLTLTRFIQYFTL
jgi:hypothetical protein